MVCDGQKNISCEQMVSIYEAKRKRMIVENINKSNYDALIFIDEHSSQANALIFNQGIQTVAIYGMGYVGQKLLKVLQYMNIQICYGIDKNSFEVVDGVRIIKPEDVLTDMDIVLVTPELYYDEIANNLRRNIDVPVVRLSEFLDELKIYI